MEERAGRRRKAQLIDRHGLILAASFGALALAFALRVSPTGAVEGGWLPLETLPPLCGSRLLLGVRCPGCGLTRSFVALAAGDVSSSLEFRRLGWLVFGLTVAQIPYRVWRLLQVRRGLLIDPAWTTWVGAGMIILLTANWILSLVG